MEPSAGSFITYVETSLGARAGAVTSVLIAVGFTIAIAGVFAMSGGMISLTLDHYTSWHPSWLPIALVISPGAPRGRAARSEPLHRGRRGRADLPGRRDGRHLPGGADRRGRTT